MRPVFAAPSIEGVRLAMPDLLGKKQVACEARCAVAIDVFDVEQVLLQRALAHADVQAKIRDVANARVARLQASLRNVDELDVRLYAVPFLVIAIEHAHAVVMRREDGTYVYESTS